MRRRHAMPFGAELRADGATRFRLWAPAARRVDLELAATAGRADLPMTPLPDGWYETVAHDAGAGSRYAFRIDDGIVVPDPASRSNPDDVDAPSMVVDPEAFEWQDDAWRGRRWEEAVLYELHVGSFTPEGSFVGVQSRLGHLADLGVTAIELMPLGEFPGRRNWGYDGVLPFAPDAAYGTPDDLKRLVQSAHARGIMVLVDVVYNHFGPQGNYLAAYAPGFFTRDRATPWGDAIDFRGGDRRPVREFFVHNALYWLEEFHVDGLRLDAVHAIFDASSPDILEEIAAAVREGPGRTRHVHLVLENHRNAAHRLGHGATRYDAQWNDDEHHALHVLLTGETDGYYADYAAAPLAQLGRCLAEGFAYQGEPSPCEDGAARGEPSAHLPPRCFVPFLQNHDQIGNRAFGERIASLAEPGALRAATEILLLAPQPPLLFMGEEWGTRTPFPYFCDFSGALAQAVSEGRRREFARFERFRDPAARATIPDPCAESTFLAAKLDWSELAHVEHAAWLQLYRRLLHLRRERVVPLFGETAVAGSYMPIGDAGLDVRWQRNGAPAYSLRANLGSRPLGARVPPAKATIYASPGVQPDAATLPPWSVVWSLDRAAG
ncbi:MAG: malto-oligosyltrehalose trehalohydrolase [Burkholderiaceae bacterium]|nr:malto-oligosyltrehalose trehalohydrolase [Burkholderiaceae bacterium]